MPALSAPRPRHRPARARTSVDVAHSRIIDPCGRVVVETDERMHFVMRDINLDFVVAHYDFNWGIPDRIMDAYPGRVKITSYRDDARFLVEPTDPACTNSSSCRWIKKDLRNLI